MMTISEELYILFIAVWLGIITSGAYCVVKVMRILIEHKKILLRIEDYAFWVIITLFMLEQIQIICGGTLRWYFVFGMMIGVVVTTVLWKSLEMMIVRVQRKTRGMLKKKNKKGQKRTQL